MRDFQTSSSHMDTWHENCDQKHQLWSKPSSIKRFDWFNFVLKEQRAIYNHAEATPYFMIDPKSTSPNNTEITFYHQSNP